MPDTPESVRDHLGNAAAMLTMTLAELDDQRRRHMSLAAAAVIEGFDLRVSLAAVRARLDRAEAALEQEGR